MKILAFAGSNSSRSINKKLVTFVSTFFESATIEILDLNDYELPLFGVDKQERTGIPDLAHEFSDKIKNADLLLISLAENNGSYSVAFKNIFDWTSRIPNQTVFHERPIFLMATSPGGRGGMSVVEAAEKRFPFNGGRVIETLSLPSVNKNFDEKKGITDAELLQLLLLKIENVKQSFEKD